MVDVIGFALRWPTSATGAMPWSGRSPGAPDVAPRFRWLPIEQAVEIEDG